MAPSGFAPDGVFHGEQADVFGRTSALEVGGDVTDSLMWMAVFGLPDLVKQHLRFAAAFEGAFQPPPVTGHPGARNQATTRDLFSAE